MESLGLIILYIPLHLLTIGVALIGEEEMFVLGLWRVVELP